MLDLSSLVNSRNELNQAIEANNMKQLSELLLQGHLNLNYVDSRDGQTPLHKSCTHGHLSATKILVENGASRHIQNDQGWFPIHLASFHGHFEIVIYLLSLDKPIMSNKTSDTSLASSPSSVNSDETESEDDKEEEDDDDDDDKNTFNSQETTELDLQFSLFNLD